MTKFDEKITLEEAVDYSKVDFNTFDFSKVEGIADCRYVHPTRRQYQKMLDEGFLPGLTEESYGALVEKFVEYVCDEE